MYRKDALRCMMEPTSQLIDSHWKPTDNFLVETGYGPNVGACAIRAGTAKRYGCDEQPATFIELVGLVPNIPCFDQWRFVT